MIELPKATVIAKQISAELQGKRIRFGVAGSAPHKFAFYFGAPEEYGEMLKGKTIGEARPYGPLILASLEPGYTLVLGGGGERILWHESEKTLPKKHQLMLQFEDDDYLTVSVQGWGSVLLLPREEVARHKLVGEGRMSPLDNVFTFDYFQSLFDELEEEDTRSIKYFLISKPGAWGMGNGCLQDILFHARIHPKRRAIDTTGEERQALYTSIRSTLKEMVDLGGRDSERDLHNHPGGYRRLLHSKCVGRPCPICGTPIEKEQYLGGAIYFCPQCQV